MAAFRVRESGTCKLVVVFVAAAVALLVLLIGRTLPLPLARPHGSRVRSELKIE